ncbi:FAD-dependent oxidoreductase [Clostridium sp. A1-XYC3]|uniref:FAD-dependent oxidoreductase n=1 Tax=Clostridium tanneri TaxID=3037988 RepID=A0ABU4JXW1_9CLOT|nr:FAD-dependent oxidoreductase [Clostridium sp. A1-XYC3]MDW8802983.1 FAD-dependent oxidoreductase [Clostridium sp. A1-XYC3]
MEDKVVIIGTGIAAISAIKAIRAVDKEIKVELYGDELFYPYNRLRLSKGLLGSLEEDKLLIQKKEWYGENNITLNKGIKVVSINTDSKELQLSDGGKADYTKLLLANGASNFVPDINGINKSGVFTLRTLQDARNIAEESSKCKTVLHIGGGILGLELAWVLAQAGKKIIVSELAERLMPRQLDERASELLENAVKNSGIDIMLGSQISEISVRESGVEGFITNKGEFISCDMVTYSIGVRPNVALLKETDIKVNRGVIVNEKMETNIPDIYAAGDIAEFDGKVYGLWNIAISQGTTAGNNIVGRDSSYKYVSPITTMNAFGLSLFSMGTIEEDKATDILVEDNDTKNYKKVFIKNNRVIGAVVIGDTKISTTLKRAIENELDLGSINFKNVYIDQLIERIKGIK